MKHFIAYILFQGDSLDGDQSVYDVIIGPYTGTSKETVIEEIRKSYRWCDYLKDVQVTECSIRPTSISGVVR